MLLTDWTDEQLLAQALAGDEEAFTACIAGGRDRFSVLHCT